MSVHAFKGGVTFWRKEVTLTCPQNGTFHDKEKLLYTGPKYTFEYKGQVKYRCEYKDDEDVKKMYYFYVKGRGE